jgi:hypothetical protein
VLLGAPKRIPQINVVITINEEGVTHSFQNNLQQLEKNVIIFYEVVGKSNYFAKLSENPITL